MLKIDKFLVDSLNKRCDKGLNCFFFNLKMIIILVEVCEKNNLKNSRQKI